jgi:MFS family permease
MQLSENTKGLLTIYAPSLVMSFGMGMIVPAIPLLAASFGVSVGLAAQVVTAQILGRMLFVLPAGAVVDAIGPKRAMIAGPALLIAAAVTAGFAPSFLILIVAVFFQGAGSNLWQIAREVAVIDLVRADQRGRAMSAFFGVAQIGTTLGPILGGVVTDAFGFRALFLVYAALGASVMAISFSLKEMAVERPRRSSFFDFGRLRDIDPLFRTTFLVLIFATFCMMQRGTIFNSMIPLFAGAELGYSATRVGTLFGIVGLVNTLMIVPSGFISDKLGRKAATVPAASLTGLAFLVFGVADGMALLVVGAALQGLAQGFSLGSLTTSTFDIAPDGSVAKFQSLRRFSAEVGTMTGPPLAGLVANLYAVQGVFLVFAPIYLVSAFLLAFVARETHPDKRLRPKIAEAEAPA